MAPPKEKRAGQKKAKKSAEVGAEKVEASAGSAVSKYPAVAPNNAGANKREIETGKKSRKEGVQNFLHSLRAKAVNLLPRQIHFVRGRIPDTSNESMKKKYISLSDKKNADEKEPKKMKVAEEIFDPNAFQPPKYYLYPTEKIHQSLTWKHMPKIGGGLQNMGNTCYINVIIQSLTYTPPIANIAHMKEHSRSCRVTAFCLFCLTENIINQLMNSFGRSLSPNLIVSGLRLIGKNFQLGQPEDAHEFYRFFVDMLHKDCLKSLNEKLEPRISETTMISQIFGGYFHHIVKCSACSFESHKYDFFMDMSIEAKGTPSLTEGISKFLKSEKLNGINQYYCPSCRKNTDAELKPFIFKAPNILSMHVKRTDYKHPNLVKLDKAMETPLTLDLTKYMSPSSILKSPTYKLYGVITHIGSEAESGHFVAFLKHANQVWYKFDDTTVSQVSQASVLSQKPYMVFYMRDEKIDPVPVSSSHKADLILQTAAPSQTNIVFGSAHGKVVERMSLSAMDSSSSSSSSESSSESDESNEESVPIEKKSIPKSSGDRNQEDADPSKPTLTEKEEINKILRPKTNKFSSYGADTGFWEDAPGVEDKVAQQVEIISQNVSFLHKKEKQRRQYDQEYDTGKLKKIKVKQPMRDPKAGNPFQKMHDRKEKMGKHATQQDSSKGTDRPFKRESGHNYSRGKHPSKHGSFRKPAPR